MGTPPDGALGILVTKGDILAMLASGDVERLPVGADDEVLTADSTQPTGLKYAAMGAMGVGAGTTFPYGGDMKSTGKYYHSHGDFTAGEATFLDAESIIVMTFAGKLGRLSWIGDAADATTVLRVVIEPDEARTIDVRVGFDLLVVVDVVADEQLVAR